MAAFDGERGEFRFAFGVSDDGAIARARARRRRRRRRRRRCPRRRSTRATSRDARATIPRRGRGRTRRTATSRSCGARTGTTASTLEGCPEDADVVRGVYEGGLKAWECARDLAAHVGTAAFDVDGLVDAAGGRVRAMELGAGQAGPGLAAARRLGARCETLTLTDYNRDVVEEVTAPNALATFALMESEGEATAGEIAAVVRRLVGVRRVRGGGRSGFVVDERIDLRRGAVRESVRVHRARVEPARGVFARGEELLLRRRRWYERVRVVLRDVLRRAPRRAREDDFGRQVERARNLSD